jgi:hypothetical protein
VVTRLAPLALSPVGTSKDGGGEAVEASARDGLGKWRPEELQPVERVGVSRKLPLEGACRGAPPRPGALLMHKYTSVLSHTAPNLAPFPTPPTGRPTAPCRTMQREVRQRFLIASEMHRTLQRPAAPRRLRLVRPARGAHCRACCRAPAALRATVAARVRSLPPSSTSGVPCSSHR